MPSAVICEPVRTPIGRYGGMFSVTERRWISRLPR